jgi:hypothetical protein
LRLIFQIPYVKQHYHISTKQACEFAAVAGHDHAVFSAADQIAMLNLDIFETSNID